MIKIIKTNKKKIIIACILIIAILLLIISITLFIIFFIDGLQENAVDKKAMQYENERKRLEYFLENEEYLNELANYFTEYPVLDRIGKNIWCSNVDESAYELNNITICMYEESSDLPLEDIVELYKKANLAVVGRRDNHIAFYLYITTYYDVYYNYYFTSSKSDYIKYDYGIITESVINENWSSVFSNIPYD